MIKNRFDYKLVNVVLITLIIYLIYQTNNFWFSVVSILVKSLLPFFIAFIIAYALAPIVSKLGDYKVPRGVCVCFLLVFIICVFGFLVFLLVPIFTQQISGFFDAIIAFLKEISIRFNVDFSSLQQQLSLIFDDFLGKIGSYISDGMINIIGISFGIISNVLITMAASIYFLLDMDKIRFKVKKFVRLRNKKIYKYLDLVDSELSKYLIGFFKIMIISFFEYTLIYCIIGHPNALILGFLAGIMNLIPYFGGIITNIIAGITAFAISPSLFIKTIIVFVLFSAIDGYVINPLVYGKSNKIHPLVVIFSVFVGGSLFGIVGVVFALPCAIVLITSYKFFRKDLINFKNYRFKLYK